MSKLDVKFRDKQLLFSYVFSPTNRLWVIDDLDDLEDVLHPEIIKIANNPETNDGSKKRWVS